MLDLADRNSLPPSRGRHRHVLMLCATLLLPAAVTTQETMREAQPREEAAATASTRAVQSPAEALSAFADKVRARHWAADRTEAVDRFRAEFVVQNSGPVTADGQESARFAVRLDATFVAPRYLRLRFEEQGTIVEQGLDQRGPWLRKIEDGRETELDLLRAGEQGKDLERDRAELARYVRVVSQLVKFLDPAQALGDLDLQAAPHQANARFGGYTLRATAVAGFLPQFPFASPLGDRSALHRAAVTFWFDDQHTLVAVRAVPIDDENRAVAMAEWTWMREHRMQDGLLLPTRLAIYREVPTPAEGPAAEGVREKSLNPQRLVAVQITSVDFDANLRPEQLSRGVRDRTR